MTYRWVSLIGKLVSVFVFENYFRKQKQKAILCCFFVKESIGKLFLKTVSENRKQ